MIRPLRSLFFAQRVRAKYAWCSSTHGRRFPLFSHTSLSLHLIFECLALICPVPFPNQANRFVSLYNRRHGPWFFICHPVFELLRYIARREAVVIEPWMKYALSRNFRFLLETLSCDFFAWYLNKRKYKFDDLRCFDSYAFSDLSLIFFLRLFFCAFRVFYVS